MLTPIHNIKTTSLCVNVVADGDMVSFPDLPSAVSIQKSPYLADTPSLCHKLKSPDLPEVRPSLPWGCHDDLPLGKLWPPGDEMKQTDIIVFTEMSIFVKWNCSLNHADHSPRIPPLHLPCIISLWFNYLFPSFILFMTINIFVIIILCCLGTCHRYDFSPCFFYYSHGLCSKVIFRVLSSFFKKKNFQAFAFCAIFGWKSTTGWNIHTWSMYL